jgi:hypothetical protein
MYGQAAEEALSEGKKKGLSGPELHSFAQEAAHEIVIRIQTSPPKKEEMEDEEDVSPEDMIEGIREAATAAGYDPDSPKFRSMCREITGRPRLDEMSEQQLMEIKKSL